MSPAARVQYHKWSAALAHIVDAMTNDDPDAILHETVDIAEQVLSRLVVKGFIANPRGGGLGA